MNSDINKYRIKFPTQVGGGTKAYPRYAAISHMAKWLELGHTLTVKTFDNKVISNEHHKAMVESAELHNRLTKFETALKERVSKKKAREKE